VQKFDFASSRPHQVASKLQIGQDGASCARALCADVRSAHADAVVEAAPETGAAPGWKQSVRRRPCSRLAGRGGTAHAPDGGQTSGLCTYTIELLVAAVYMEIGCCDRRRSVQEVPPITGGVVARSLEHRWPAMEEMRGM
jgi:hypothetical protein